MKTFHQLLGSALCGALIAHAGAAEGSHPVAEATNALGLDLYHQFAKNPGNLCLSPYSIQAAFAMTANGAAGETLAEMQKVLHLPSEMDTFNVAHASLIADFEKRAARAADWAERTKTPEPGFQLAVANRLFGQKDYPFAEPFLDTLANQYAAPLQMADFKNKPDAERVMINDWAEEQTRDRIKNLLPQGSIDSTTRLVLANALYFKAGWTKEFSASSTKAAAFRLGGEKTVDVPTMHGTKDFGYSKEDGYTAVSLPYAESFSMLLLVPDEIDGLPAVANGLTAGKLSSLARLRSRKVALAFPKFKIEGASVALKTPLERLGMKLAFNPGRADFGAITKGGESEGLFISDAFHKTFIAVDEKGTEAAAATAVVMSMKSAMRPEEPVVVKVDRPFFYAIMDGRSGTALFVGRVSDPR